MSKDYSLYEPKDNEDRARDLLTTMIANAGMVTLHGDEGRNYCVGVIEAALREAEDRGRLAERKEWEDV